MTATGRDVGRRGRMRWKSGGVRGEGRIIGYSADPQALVMDDNGKHSWWRADLVDLIEEYQPRHRRGTS